MNIYDKKIFDKIYEVHSEGVMKASKSEKRNWNRIFFKKQILLILLYKFCLQSGLCSLQVRIFLILCFF